MIQYAVKILITSCLVVAITEISKRSVFWGGLLASLPLTTFLALVWLYADTRSPEKAAALSMSVFWLVLPTLIFFPVLSTLLTKARWPFTAAITASMFLMLAAYGGMVRFLRP